MILVELVMPFSGIQGRILALLNSGCIRCVVSPEVIEKLGLRLKRLKVRVLLAR